MKINLPLKGGGQCREKVNPILIEVHGNRNFLPGEMTFNRGESLFKPSQFFWKKIANCKKKISLLVKLRI